MVHIEVRPGKSRSCALDDQVGDLSLRYVVDTLKKSAWKDDPNTGRQENIQLISARIVLRAHGPRFVRPKTPAL